MRAGFGGIYGLDFGAVTLTAAAAGALKDGGGELLAAVLPHAEAAVLSRVNREREE